MVPIKNYETMSKFAKVMPRILQTHFFPDTVYLHTITHAAVYSCILIDVSLY